MGLIVEDVVRTEIISVRTVERLPQVVRSIGGDFLRCLLRPISGLRQVQIKEGSDELVPKDRLERRNAYPVLLPSRVISREQDSACSDFRLVDRWYWLWVIRQPR